MIPQSEPGCVPVNFPKTESSKAWGSVIVKRPKLHQRFQYMDLCGYEVNEEGQTTCRLNKMQMVAKLSEIIEPHILKADLETVNGEKIDTVEGMFVSGECQDLIMKVGEMVLSGFGPSKN